MRARPALLGAIAVTTGMVVGCTTTTDTDLPEGHPVVADFDGDGHADTLYGAWAGSGVAAEPRVAYGDGDGTMKPPWCSFASTDIVPGRGIVPPGHSRSRSLRAGGHPGR